MINIVVTGALGQLGRSVRDEIDRINSTAKESIFLPTYIDRDEVDLSDEAAVDSFFSGRPCDVVINCAAFTDVDRAEVDKEEAKRGNVDSIANIAKLSVKNDFRVIHISTDYVFDGKSRSPYKEDEATNPHTVYGKTKLEGENALFAINPQAVVVRTAWLYSKYGKNFFLTMREKAGKKAELKVVDDQHGTPTLASDLAETILKIAMAKDRKPGIYNYTNEGDTTWFDFAREIYRLSGQDINLVQPISSGEYHYKTPRPEYSVLDKTKIIKTFGIDIPHWKESLKKLIVTQDGF